MKPGHLIEYNKRNNFFQKLCRKLGRQTSSRPLYFSKKLIRGKAMWSAAQFQYISIALNLAYNKNDCVKLQTIDSEICSISIFQKRVWDQFLHHILCMIFQEKCFSCYILLTDQISLPDCLYFSRYWVICGLQLFVNQVVTSQNLKLTLLFNLT